MMGTTREALSSNVRDYMHPVDCATDCGTPTRGCCAARLDHYQVEKRLYRPDGGWVWANLTVSLVRDDAAPPLYLVAMIEDVTERHDLQERLRYQATHDPLTGLPNRALFLERLARSSTPRAATGQTVGLCYLDLDGFKVINDSLGHDVGDRLLVAVATRLDEAVAGDRAG